MSEEVNELAAKLARRTAINDGEAKPELASTKVFNPYTEFPVRPIAELG